MSHQWSGLEYRQVDVFSEGPLSGNGLAVFWQSEDLSPEVMQRLTQELRQFESIFVSAAGRRTFRARIFTMEEELDFAGHPVLGAAAVLHERLGGTEPEVWTLELNAKPVEVRSRPTEVGYHATMDQGKPEFGSRLTEAEARPFWKALALSPEDRAPGHPLEVVSTGLPYLIVPVAGGLEGARIVAADFEALLATVGAKFVYVLDVERREGRTWDNAGQVEDIATGSAAGPAGAYLVKHSGVSTRSQLVLLQGRFAGRPSRLVVGVEAGAGGIESVWVSGEVSLVATGVLD